jgi:hypothetical protein
VPADVGGGEEEEEGVGESAGVAVIDEEPGLTVTDEFGEAAGASCDDGFSESEGFECGAAEGLGPGGQDDEVAIGNDAWDVVTPTEEGDGVSESGVFDAPAEGAEEAGILGTHGAADEEDAKRGEGGEDAGKRGEEELVTLPWGDLGDVGEDGDGVGDVKLATDGAGPSSGAEGGEVDAVSDGPELVEVVGARSDAEPDGVADAGDGVGETEEDAAERAERDEVADVPEDGDAGEASGEGGVQVSGGGVGVDEVDAAATDDA